MRTVLLKIIIGILLGRISLQLYQFYKLNSSKCHRLLECQISRRLVVMLPLSMLQEPCGTLELAERVFNRIGYETQHIGNHGNHNIWDVLWTRLYPFNDPRVLQLIKNSTSNQKINHYPGISFLASKDVFNTFDGGSKYTPKTFKMPNQKQEFLKEIGHVDGKMRAEDNRVWIQKHVQHRGNVVKAVKDLDLTSTGLIQEFIRNQFLLHGHVINIGINVIITSVSPLRAYILDGAWLVRICNKPFHPINYNDISTYVTDGGHMSRHLFEFPQMKRYFDTGYSRKQALLAYIKSELGKDPSQIEDQIYDAIQDTLAKRQRHLKATPRPPSQPLGPPWSSYFEVMRWDFLLDEDLNVHLIEANMSPAMEVNERIIRSKNEHLIYSTLSTIGYIRGSTHEHGLRSQNTFLDLDVCYTSMCEGQCNVKICELCSRCLSKDRVNMMKVASVEHINRQGLRPVYPPRMVHADAYDKINSSNSQLTKCDHIYQSWLRAKCVDDSSWC